MNPQVACHYEFVIGFEDACVAAPVGAALLAGLEARERDDVQWFDMPNDSLPEAVEAAVATVRTMPFGGLCSITLSSASSVGPWIEGAPEAAAAAYRWAEARRPIAAAIADRFDADLHARMDPIGQQWWTSPGLGGPRLAPLFQRYSHVYENGEFTWAGLWTVTDPPVETHDELVDAWELWQPIGRWHLPVNENVRVFEVHRPDDWAAPVSPLAPGLLRRTDTTRCGPSSIRPRHAPRPSRPVVGRLTTCCGGTR
jgi:hypothetical protein